MLSMLALLFLYAAPPALTVLIVFLCWLPLKLDVNIDFAAESRFVMRRLGFPRLFPRLNWLWL